MWMCLALAVLPAATARSEAQQTGTQPATRGLTDVQLETLDRAALGARFVDGDEPRLRKVHALLERYFISDTSSERKILSKQIAATGFDPSDVGRIVRIRLDWQPLKPGVYYVNERATAHEVRYFLGIPQDYDVTNAWPLVVKLPTANAFLSDPPPDAEQVTRIYTQWINEELARHPRAIVLMPLLNLDRLYGPGPAGMDLVLQPILHAAGKANIDPARVYLIGHSMAAHAVWNLALHYPTYFAAINPLAGAAHETWQRVRLGNLRNIHVVAWADRSDPVVNVNETRSLVRYLRTLNYDVDYDETKDLGHVPNEQIVEQDYQRSTAQTRQLYPHVVFLQSNRQNTEFNRVDWVQIYQPLSPGPLTRLAFTHGGERIAVYQNSFRAVASITLPNTIHIDTLNVQTLRLYLNDQMVDFSKPVEVIVNGKTRFDGLVVQSMDEMLNDQLFLGRGWRYFTGIIDLDLTQTPTTASSRP